MVDDGPDADVSEQGAHLGRSVVLVDVERHRAGPVGTQHGFHVLHAVVHDEGDGILPALPPLELETLPPETQAVGAQEGGDRPGPLGDLTEGPPHVAAHQHRSPRHRGRHDVVDRGEGPLSRRHCEKL